MAHFSWLEEKRRQAAEEKMMQGARRPVSFATTPLRMRYMGNTGAGPDGVVQPQNPTHMINTNAGRRMLHEDEQVYVGPKNELNVIPSEQTQQQLKHIERRDRVPGYQLGLYQPPTGWRPPGTTAADVFGPPTTTLMMGNGRESTGAIAPTLSAPQQQSFNVPTMPGATGNNFSFTAPESKQAPNLSFTAPQQQSFEVPTFQSKQAPNLSFSVPDTSEFDVPGAANIPNPYAGKVSRETSEFDVPGAANIPNPYAGKISRTPTETSPLPSTQVATTTTPATATQGTQPSQADQWRTTALGRLADASAGNIPGYDANAQKYMSDLKATIDNEQMVAAQQAAQTRLSPEVAGARQAMGRAMGRQALGEAANQMVAGKAGLQMDATKDLATEALNSQNYEQRKMEYADEQGWNTYERFLRAGDYQGAAAEFERITGRKPDMTALSEDRDYIMQKRGQDIEQGELTLESMRTSLGDQKFNSALGQIAAGRPYDPSMGISQAEYNAMRTYTAAGETDWTRQLQGANMLLQTQEPGNIQQAAQMYSNLFPGTSFTFDQLIGDLGSDRFADGMADMATLSSTFDTWEDAKNSAQGLGLITKLGGEAVAQELFFGTKVNAIDEQWDTIEQSDWYQNLATSDNPEDRDAVELIQRTFQAELTGELTFDLVDEYTVKDSSGKTVGKYASIEDANKKISENADKGYTVQETSRYVFKDMNTGDNVSVNVGGTTIGTNGTGVADNTFTPPSDETDRAKRANYTGYSDSLYTMYRQQGNTALPTNGEWDDWYSGTGRYIDPAGEVIGKLKTTGIVGMQPFERYGVVSNLEHMPPEVKSNFVKQVMDYQLLGDVSAFKTNRDGSRYGQIDETHESYPLLRDTVWMLPDGQYGVFSKVNKTPGGNTFVFINESGEEVGVAVERDGTVKFNSEKITTVTPFYSQDLQ
jgi:hypothetical protein